MPLNDDSPGLAWFPLALKTSRKFYFQRCDAFLWVHAHRLRQKNVYSILELCRLCFPRFQSRAKEHVLNQLRKN